ncbi:MAG: type II toxin-antitoxin system HicB family antitoxin [Bacteroidales bacterium]|nr:type II toxin-antitoxin system HicB family antitoxin [Bacteroidales bacterium]
MASNDYTFTAVYVEVPEGGYAAYVEEIPGVNSQGETLEDAKVNLKEALQLVLETNRILARRNLDKGIKRHREPLTFV